MAPLRTKWRRSLAVSYTHLDVYKRQEFTQIDCEMSFVEREDVLNTFEDLMKHLFKSVLKVEFKEQFPRISYADAMRYYGSDKPDIRFGMKIREITDKVKGHDFVVFDSSPYIGGIVVEGIASYTRKQIDELTEWVKRPQVGAKGLIYIRVSEEGITVSYTHLDVYKRQGFIRAEVIKYDDFVALGSEVACRAAGKLNSEGKEYVVQDGDIMHFLFNV